MEDGGNPNGDAVAPATSIIRRLLAFGEPILRRAGGTNALRVGAHALRVGAHALRVGAHPWIKRLSPSRMENEKWRMQISDAHRCAHRVPTPIGVVAISRGLS